MKENSPESIQAATTLCYQGVVPVEWESLKGPPEQELLHRYEHDNAVLLQGMTVMDEQPVVEREEELSSLGQELQRIDYKLNLVLELLAQALRSWRKLPIPVPVRLNVEGVSWCSRERLPVNEPVMVRLYLSPVFPNPFVASGRVESLQEEAEGYRVSVRFDGLGSQVRDALEKMVFRQHRRDVARARMRRRADGEGGSS